MKNYSDLDESARDLLREMEYRNGQCCHIAGADDGMPG